MKIVRDVNLKIVFYIFKNNTNIELENNMKVSQLRIPDINSRTHEVVENVEAPPHFFGACMSYENGKWSIENQKLYDIMYQKHLQEIIEKRCKQIEKTTQASIVDTVGDDIHQRNLTAKAVQLARKETKTSKLEKDVEDGIKTLEEVTPLLITEDEVAQLDYLEGLFNTVEILRIEGNTKEIQIQACTTIEEFEAKCLELGV